MDLDQIFSEWDKDRSIDNTALDKASLDIPYLHGKYLKLYTHENSVLKRMTAAFKREELIRFNYYSGKLSEEELKDNQLEPFNLKVMRQDVPRYLEADKKLNGMTLQMELQKEKIDALKSILNMISNRSFQINNAIKWNQFLSGE